MAISSADDARESGTGWSAYEPRLDAAQQRSFILLSGLAAALHTSGQLRLAYQPRISLADGCSTSFEALLRWTHPTLDPIGPAEFGKDGADPRAELPGSRAGNSAVGGLASAGATFKVAISVSASYLDDPSFGDHVAALLASYHLDPQRFEVEFTEKRSGGQPWRGKPAAAAVAGHGGPSTTLARATAAGLVCATCRPRRSSWTSPSFATWATMRRTGAWCGPSSTWRSSWNCG